MIMHCGICYFSFKYTDRQEQLGLYPYCPDCGSGKTYYINSEHKIIWNN